MARVKILTDSTAYLPQEYVDQYGIEVIPLTLNWNGNSYRDGVDIKADEFYTKLKGSDTLPTTNAISIHTYTESIQKALDEGFEVLILPISSGISASYFNAVKALETFKGKAVDLFDTQLVSMALSFMVLTAARAAEKGGTLGEVKQAALDTYPHIGVYFTVATLKYLHKGGRIGGAKRLLGSALSIKPILQIRDGKIEASGSAVTRKKALERLMKLVSDGIGDQKPIRISVFHALDLSTAQDLMERCKKEFDPLEIILSEVSPVVGSHVGPGTVSIAWMAGVQ
jgi:DegV family protein with EDD domain